MTPRDEETMKERLAELAGTGGRGNRTRRAVRVEHLAALLSLSNLKSKAPAGTAPTAAEYNQLRADLEKVHSALRAVAAAIQGDAS